MSTWGNTFVSPKGTLKRTYPNGTVQTTLVGANINTSTAGSQTSVSSPGPPYVQDNNWTKSQGNVSPGRLSGRTLPKFGSYYELFDYPVLYPSGSLPDPNWSYYATLAIGNLNPNNPVFDFPQALAELKDFPGFHKDLGKFLYKLPENLRDLGLILKGTKSPGNVGKGYLAYQFGWKPLVNDLRSIIQFTEETDKTIARLAKAHRKKRISGVLESKKHYVSTSVGGYTLPYNFAKVTWRSELYTTRKVWYSAKLYPNYTLPNWNSPLARAKWALGLNVSASTLWELIPWSWLVDYFVNIGNFLDATRGGLPHVVSTLCIMCHDQNGVENFRVTPTYGWGTPPHGSPPINSGHRKLRKVVVNPRPVITYDPNPFMGHLAILGALAISRIR